MPFPSVLTYDNLTRNGVASAGEETLYGLWKKIQGLTGTGAVGSIEGYKAGGFTAPGYGMYFTTAPEAVQAVAVEVNRLPEFEERLVQLFACLSNPASAAINGYRMRLVEEAPANSKKFTLKIEKITAEAYSELYSTTAVVVEAKDHIGLSVEGGKVIAWRKKGAGGSWEALHETADSSYTTGYVGFGSSGGIAQLKEFRCGKVKQPERPTPALLDSFKRTTETPLSNGGKWLVQRDEANVAKSGYVVSEQYKSQTSYGEPSNNYWGVGELTNPFVALETSETNVAGRAFHLWLCMTLSGAEHKVVSGYRLELVYGGSGELESIRLWKYASEVKTLREAWEKAPLNNAANWKYGVGLTEGKVVLWCKMNANCEWLALASITESTYTKGYVGIGDNGSTQGQVNFEAASLEVGPKTVEAAVALRTGARTAQISTAPANAAIALRVGVRVGVTVSRPFPITFLLDSLARVEDPLNNAGKWRKLGWVSNRGRCEGATYGWTANGGYSEALAEYERSGAYWTPSPFGSPALCELFQLERQIESEPWPKYVRVWSCVGVPDAGTRNGYALYIAAIPEPPTANKYVFTLEKWVAGVRTVLATTELVLPEVQRYVGITVASGKVEGWLSTDNTIPHLEPILVASDATYTRGYVGIEGLSLGLQYGSLQFRAGGDAIVPLRSGARIVNAVAAPAGNPMRMLL